MGYCVCGESLHDRDIGRCGRWTEGGRHCNESRKGAEGVIVGGMRETGVSDS